MYQISTDYQLGKKSLREVEIFFEKIFVELHISHNQAQIDRITELLRECG